MAALSAEQVLMALRLRPMCFVWLTDPNTKVDERGTCSQVSEHKSRGGDTSKEKDRTMGGGFD